MLRNQLFRSLEIEVDAIAKKLDHRNARKLLKGADLVIDTFDNSQSRRLVQQHCRDPNVECLHVGLYADYCEVIWDESYRIPRDVAGDNVGCLLRKTSHQDVKRGQVLAAAGSITPHTRFEAEVYVLKKEEGGRHTPFFNGYTPQFFFRTADVTGTANVCGDAQMAMPGEGVKLSVSLQRPSALADGDRFAVREGSRTVDSGVVTKVNV